MARPTESPFVALVTLAALTAIMTGVSRTGFSKAENATNTTNTTFNATTPGQLEALTGTFVELLPLLVLVVGGIVVLRTVQ